MMLLKPKQAPADKEPAHELAAEKLNAEGGPFLRAAWRDVLMMHFVIEPEDLQPHTPFPLDLFDGQAVITLVFFTMNDLRFARRTGLPNILLKPGEHRFLNVRTYVRVNDEPGIHFLREYVPRLLARFVGPATYGLPYRFTQMDYTHERRNRRFIGKLAWGRGAVDADYAFAPEPTEVGGFNEFVLERYNAFNRRWGATLCFRVAHPPWEMRRAKVAFWRDELLRRDLPFWRKTRLVHTHFTEGFTEVGMGAPVRMAF